uniref:Signal recognition particle n=1 Tax=Mesocestoides corti TaxID=53468 RepID=A0A5K3FMX4_MESCO
MLYLRGKCVIIGAQTVGKTSLSYALVAPRKEFPHIYQMTIVPELTVRNTILQDIDANVEFLIYDYPGCSIHFDQFAKYIGTPNVFVLVFDVTDRSSFTACKSWMEKINSGEKHPKIPGVLIGNKTDLVFRRKVEEDEARNYAEYLGIKYYELSVKDARNLLEPFISLAREYYELYQISANKFKELL